MIVFFITSVLIYKDIKAVGDVTDEKITPARMFAGRVIYLMIFLYAVLTTQADEIYTHLAIWMPLWIFSFVNLFKKFIDTFAESQNK